MLAASVEGQSVIRNADPINRAHPRFVEDVLRLAGIPASGFRSVPAPRFVINRRIDLLCQLLMEETEQGCPSGRPHRRFCR